jgi:DNA-binding transcriptional regulator YdaS (Cro superfamily)
MELKKYIRLLNKGERESFAESCGATLQHLKFVGYKAKQCSEKLAIRIEQATNGKVTVEELRPDLIEQWAYLRSTGCSCDDGVS